MRLLELSSGGQVSLTRDFFDNIPPYAILSHTWGADEEEVTFTDLRNGLGMNKSGYSKIMFCGEMACQDGLHYFWVDTCCIDSSNSSELSEAINSMFRWYRAAKKCYVYLSDVSVDVSRHKGEAGPVWEGPFRQSRWFTRSWTLQELLAPQSVVFFSREGEALGSKHSLEQQIHKITRISISALRGAPLYEFTIEERLSWAQTRNAKRPEDRAYSLLGIFDVNLPLIYGEGHKALTRLLQEIDTSRVALAPSTKKRLYQSLKGSEFRILIVNPGLEGSEITSYIQRFDLEEPPEYNALSYTWGDEPPIHAIDINHRRVFIRPNLFHALQRMRARTRPIYLWVDSLCIHQSNELEKSEQVLRMAEIYRSAKSVWIWLGEEDSSSTIAMDFIPQIIRDDFRWEILWWKEYAFTAFDLILEKSWFRRRWVIQEAAFSANSVIFCGNRQVHMNDFARAINLVRTRLASISPSSHMTREEIPSEEVLTNFRDSPATRLLDIINAAFHRSKDGTIISLTLGLETLVDLASFCETKDERDTIFALLSLANDAGLTSDALTDSILPDYANNMLEVFVSFILHCCQKSGSADVICRPWAPVPRSAYYAKTRRSQADQALVSKIPSWIASMDGLQFGNPSRRLSRRLNGKPLTGSSSKRVYNAHYGTKPQVKFGKYEPTNSYNGSLYIRGIFLGEITQRSTRMADAIIRKECLDILGRNDFDQQSNAIGLPDIVWRTLCANRDDRGEPAPLNYRSAMNQILQICSEAVLSDHWPDQIRSVSSIDIEALLETAISEDVEKFLRNVRDVVWNRQAFRGQSHGDSSVIVGLAPQHAEVGDQVCILYGCSVPVVLRKNMWTGGHYWQLIGDAYVDAVMDGEKISSMQPAMLEAAESEFEIR